MDISGGITANCPEATKTPNDNAVEPFNWIIVVNGLQALSVAYDAYRGIVRYLDYMHALRVGGNVDGSGSRPVREVRHNILLVCKNREIANVFNQYPSFSAYRLADLDLSVSNSWPIKYFLLRKDMSANIRSDTERRVRQR